MKILHVLHHSLPAPLDGYAIRSHAILRAQQCAGASVCALTGSHQPAYPGEEVSIDGIRYLRTPSELSFNTFGYMQISRYRALKKRLRQVMAASRPDVVHVHSPAYNGLATLAAARPAKIPVVYEVRATWEDAAVEKRHFGVRSAVYRAAVSLESHVLKRADAVVTICEGLKGEVLRRGVDPDRVFVAPSGVNTDDFCPSPPDRELAAALGLKEGVVIGFIGSLFSYEGIEDLLDVIPAVLERCPNVSFLIVGGGERQAQVTGRTQELSATGRVVYKTRVTHGEVRGYYSLLDCLVYPRRSVRLTELVTPLKPLEAMAMQKAVVASNIGGHRELISQEQTGLLYEAANPRSLTEALCRVVADSDFRKRLAGTGRRYVMEHRQWNQLTQNHFAAYDKALAGFATPASKESVARVSPSA